MKTLNNNAFELLEAMEKEVTRLQRTIQALKNNVGRDDLTGLLRRNELFAQIEDMKAASPNDFAVIILDIDNFKRINDTEGHQTGDLVIQRVAAVIARAAKANACVGRYGGEEFLIAHCGSAESAKALAEAVRRQIEREVCVTVSVGVATALQAKSDISRMVEMADEALYVAKKSGKNRVALAA